MQDRVFKAAWFVKAARKAGIGDDELCRAAAEIALGQADDLGGGVFKKRLDKNRSRSIVLTGSRAIWVFQYLFAKKDRENIRSDELGAFRLLARGYDGIAADALATLVQDGDLVEICREQE